MGAVQAAFSVQGLDVTDEGYSLSMQWLVHAHPASLTPDPRWLSHWLCGLSPLPGLLGLKLGWAAVSALCALAVTAILSPLLGPRRAALAALATALAKLFGFPGILDYNALPAALALLASWALLAPPTAWRWQLAGLLLGVAVACRPPLLPLLALPLLLLLLRAALDRRWPAGWGRAGAASLTALASGAALSAWLVAEGRVPAPWALVPQDPEAFHSPSRLLHGLWISGQLALIRGGQGLAAALALGLLAALAAPGRRGVWAGAGGIALGGWLLWWTSGEVLACAVLLPGLTFTLGGGALLGLLLRGAPAARERAHAEALGLGLVLMLAIPLGSTNGFLGAHQGLWLAWPAACTLAARGEAAVPGRRGGSGLRARWLGTSGLALLLACALLGPLVRWGSPWRDGPGRLALRKGLDEPLLWGVLTSPGRADSLNGVLTALRGRVRPGEPLLAYAHVPLLHRLTGTVPALGDPWPCSYHAREVERRLARWGPDGAPRLAVRALCDTWHPAWGARFVPWDAAGVRDSIHVIDAALTARGYREVWRSRDFVLLERP